MKIVNLRPYVKSITDLSSIGYDCDIVFNNIGNFSILPFQGNYIATFRMFAYHIDSRGRYLSADNLRLENPDKYLFVLLDRNFNFVKRIPNSTSTYWQHPEYNTELPYLEDGRLVNWNGDIYISSSIYYQQDKHWKQYGTEVQKISIDNELNQIETTHIWNAIESGIDGGKNWLPIPDQPFRYIVGTSPNGVRVADISSSSVMDFGKYDE